MKLFIFPRANRYFLPSRKDWQIAYCSFVDINLVKNVLGYFPLCFGDYIKSLKPDFVLIICSAVTEKLVNISSFPKGPKYITWSTDDYRHTERVTNSDLHLSSIPSMSMRCDDNYVPLFHNPLPMLPLEQRLYRLGIVNRVYDTQEYYREKEIRAVQRVVPDILIKNNIDQYDYYKTCTNFKYGLNIGVYQDSLPNFRSFELGATGAMPVVPAHNQKIQRDLFEDNIRFYSDPKDIPSILDEGYDAEKLREFYKNRHSFQQRLREIFRRFFDIDFPLI